MYIDIACHFTKNVQYVALSENFEKFDITYLF